MNLAERKDSEPFCLVSPPPQTNVDDLCMDKDKSTETSKPDLPIGEHIVTLHPYMVGPKSSKQQKNDKNKPEINRQTTIKNASSRIYEELFRPACWPRFFNVTLTNKDDFILDELMLKNGHNVTLNKMSDGQRLIEVHSKNASDTLKDWINNPPENMAVATHTTLNQVHGTVVVPDDIECEGLEFLHWGPKIQKNLELRNIPVESVTTFYAKNRRSKGPDLKIAKISFGSHELPKDVKLAGHNLEVRPYIGRPRQCNKCWRYGHPTKYCKNDLSYCAKCSQTDHTTTNCDSEILRCVNCGGAHQANSKGCTHYDYNSKIYQFQQKHGFPRRAAITHLKRTNVLSKITYASHLRKAGAVVTTSPTGMPTPALEQMLHSPNRFQSLSDECKQAPEEPEVIPRKGKRSLPTSPTVQESDFKKRHNISQDICPNSPSTEPLIDLFTESVEINNPSPNVPSTKESRMDIIVPPSLIDVHIPASPIISATSKAPKLPVFLKGNDGKEASVRSKLPRPANMPSNK